MTPNAPFTRSCLADAVANSAIFVERAFYRRTATETLSLHSSASIAFSLRTKKIHWQTFPKPKKSKKENQS
jgi:hypothetical protein